MRIALPGNVPGSTTPRLPVLVAFAAVCCMGTLSYPSQATSRSLRPAAMAPEQRSAAPSRRATDTRPAARYDEYRVAAGTALPIELRTVLSSNSSRAGDVLEGRLQRAITAGDVELVPADAVVLGTVTEAEPAGPGTPGHLAFTFTVIQHPETGSRAMMRASVLAFRSETPRRGKALPDLALAKGTDATVTLLQPLVVRIPIVDTTR